ncbi:MAG: 16S rRNA (cytosine(1402)-N(4))-methyltransferase RsmH [Spirochaetia bacterium]
MDTVHYSVMTEEVLEYLAPRTEHALLIDATLGEGGHSERFLSTFPSLKIGGIDADEQILEKAKQRLAPYGDRFRGYHNWFNVFFKEYPLGGEQPDSILFDLGISLYHYEKAEKGFTFQKDEPLDMRLDGNLEIAAMDIVNNYPEEELKEIISDYGEERYAGSISRAICRERTHGEIRTSSALASVIRRAVPPKYRYGSIHPATRTFQALRIMVNGELVRLQAALESSLKVLKVGGRIGVISFHSLEDRIVKWFFKEKNKDCTCPPDWPICKCGGKRVVDLLTKKPLRPKEEEVEKNSPSRSAKFRVIEKLREEEE